MSYHLFETSVGAKRDFWQPDGSLSIFLHRRISVDGVTKEVQMAKTEFTSYDPNAVTNSFDPPASLSLKNDEAVKLMDALWSCGIRPTKTPNIEAESRHLSDMRAIAFKFLDLKAP